MRQEIENQITESIRIKQNLIEQIELIEKMAVILVDCMRGGGKVVFFGNGGSAADAQHLACELSGRFLMDRPALPALALSTNTSTITAIGNDYGFEQIFSRQLLGIGVRGDVGSVRSVPPDRTRRRRTSRSGWPRRWRSSVCGTW